MNARRVGFILIAVSSSFLHSEARAELKWEQSTIELHPALGDKEAVGHFKYENVGQTPVHFKSVKASCSCTAAQPQKNEVAPGEKGDITATFKIGAARGTAVKTVTVETDDPAHPSTVLTLKAVIPDGLTISPSFVFWKAGEEGTPKTMTVKADKDFPAKNLTVTSSNADFSVEVKNGAHAGEWSIVVQPKQTARPIATMLTIKPDQPKDLQRVFTANANVMAAPPAGPSAALSH